MWMAFTLWGSVVVTSFGLGKGRTGPRVSLLA